jgi:hypothetical protein
MVDADRARSRGQFDLVAGSRVGVEEHSVVGGVTWSGGAVGDEQENLAVTDHVDDDGDAHRARLGRGGGRSERHHR